MVVAADPSHMVLDRFREGGRAGVRATGAMTLPMMVAKVTGMSPMPRPIPAAIVRKVLGEDAPKPVVAVATLFAHASYGGTWGALLASSDEDVSVAEGVGLGVGLWVLLGAVLMPWLGWGFFGRKVSGKVAPATLLLHLVYGGALGKTLSGGDRERDVEPASPQVAPTEETDHGG